MLTHYFNIFIEALKYKHHLIPSLCSCLFIWDNQTTVDTRPAQEPSIYGVVDKGCRQERTNITSIHQKKRRELALINSANQLGHLIIINYSKLPFPAM